MTKTITQPCEHCGTILTKKPAIDRSGKSCSIIFCNRSCYDAYRKIITITRNRPIVVCSHCGIEYQSRSRKKDEKHYRHFCSEQCRISHKKAIPKNCVRCGCLFTPVKLHTGYNKMISYNAGKTCSHECHMAWIRENEDRKQKISEAFTGDKHPNWQGGTSRGYGSYRGPNWKQQRTKALKRDGYKCIVCGMTNDEHMEKYGNGLHVNHIEPYHNINNYKIANRLSNLESLCVTHHSQREDRSMVQLHLDLSDGDKHFRRRSGYAKPNAKLTKEDVLVIREKYKNGLTVQEIHINYEQVGLSCIRDVVNHKTWKNI